MLVPASIVVAGLQVGPVSASRSAESTGSAVEQEQPAEPSSERLTRNVQGGVYVRVGAGVARYPPGARTGSFAGGG